MDAIQTALEPYGAVPNARQVNYFKRKKTAFLHFTINTFTDKEWGDGTEDPQIFNPVKLDCEQWMRALKEAGFSAAILTAKHHDGFCLWPSNRIQFNSTDVESYELYAFNGEDYEQIYKGSNCSNFEVCHVNAVDGSYKLKLVLHGCEIGDDRKIGVFYEV